MPDTQPAPPSPAEDEAFSASADVLPPEAEGGAHWRALVTQIGSEIAVPLSAAMERITALAATGKIDRHNLRMLREEVEVARRAGMVGQQLARFGSGRVRQSPERVHLTRLLRDVLVQRGRDLQSRGLPLRQMLKSVEVIADASLLFALLNALLDWCAEHARSAIDVRLGAGGWPVQGRLGCRFAFRLADEAQATSAPLDTLTWRLLQQTAWTMGLTVEREDSGIETSVTITFPRTVHRDAEGPALEGEEGPASSQNSKPLAGSHVLVLASRREVRAQVREAIANMGLILDFVTSVEEAREFCNAGMPHALVYESLLGGERLDRLRDELREEVPQLVFVEVLEDGDLFQVSGAGAPVARVGREGLASSLPSVLVFELSRTS